MTAIRTNPPRRSPARHAARHAGAVALALALNLALVLFMVTWLARRESSRPAAALAFPLQVQPIEPEEMEMAEGPVAEEAAPVPPAPRPPPLPEPEILEVTAPVPAMPQPALPTLEPADAATASSLAVPAFEGVARGAPPAPPPVGGGDAEGEPAVGRPSRGPILMRPPDLSEYYPRRARMRGTTGATRLRLTVDADGRVRDVEVLASSPAGVFEHAARRVGRSLAFRPALRDGRPVPARVTLRLVWRLES